MEKQTDHDPLADLDDFLDSDSIPSSMECTGLIPTPPKSEAEAEAYTEIYDIPKPENDHENGIQSAKGIASRPRTKK